jgi:hypothetical protein
MLATFRPWTKKALKELVARAKTEGKFLPAGRVLMETSMFGAEIKPNTMVAVCLNHPKRTTFAQVVLDAHENIVQVR